MKRVDRTRELKRQRPLSLAMLVFFFCIVVGPSLVSVGTDNHNPTISILGILVLLVGPVSLFALPTLFRQRKGRIQYLNLRRETVRSVLLAGFFTAALATVGLLYYGIEYADSMTLTFAVIVMWVAIATLVSYLWVPRSKTVGGGRLKAIRLSVSNLSDARSLGLEWPNDEQGLWIGIYALNIVDTLDTKFLLANVPREHRIFAAVTAWDRNQEHETLRNLLQAAGDQYQEKLEQLKGDTWNTIFLSTQDSAVIKHIFENYRSYYGSEGSYPFVVAKGDLLSWSASLVRLSEKGLHGLTRELIRDCYCVMLTAEDYGLEMFTNKIPEENIVQTAKEIASDASLPLVNIGDEADN